MPVIPLRKLALDRCIAAILASGAVLPVIAQPQPIQVQEQPSSEFARYEFDIPAQGLGDALQAFARAARQQVSFDGAAVAGRTSTALVGRYTADEAIRRLLQETGMEFRRGPEGVWMVAPLKAFSPAEAENVTMLQEIVVTGTHIRGASITSPVIVVSRDSIETAGQNDLGEVARSVPQNFGGGQNPGVGNGAGLINTNLNSSSHLNLRGLGPDATLTLLNGHRLPYDGAFGGVDISAIPVAAVERIEIVPDGASAQYGSDAVAGVANIILRRDFNGLITSARLGGTTSGGNFQQGADIVAGSDWPSGGMMIAYQFANNSAIFARQRDIAISLPEGNSIYPSIRQHSLLLSGRQMLADEIEFRIDGLYNHRGSRTVGGNLGTTGLTRFMFAPSAESFSIAPELAVNLGGSWMARASLAYGKNDSHYDTLITPPGRAGTRTSGCYCNSAVTAELVFDGPILSLPGGDVRVGLGGGYRSNSMRYSQLQDGTRVGAFDVDRQSHHLFGEVEIPVVGPRQDLRFLRRLTFTAAARHENYPGMGAVTTPKFGLVYEPDANIAIKASWGRSFKAPTLYQQYVGYETYLLPAAAYGAASAGTLIYASGGNPSLSPERARSWSTGIELHPAATPGLRLTTSYFNVRYRDRVTRPIAGSIASAFSDPGYASLLDRAPSASLLDHLIAGSLYGLTNFADEPYDPASVAVLVDNRNRNVARQNIEGVDLDLRYRFEIGAGQQLDLSGSATYLKSDQLLTSALPNTELAGTVFNPPHWRGRAGASWQGDRFTLSAFVNHIGKLTDARFTSVATVGSMLTVDITARIDVGSASSSDPAFDMTLVVNNLFNEMPDLIQTRGSSDTPYDSTNFSPIGRFIGLKISRSW